MMKTSYQGFYSIKISKCSMEDGAGCIDVPNSTKKRCLLWIWKENYTSAQTFLIEPQNGYYTIKSACSNLFLTSLPQEEIGGFPDTWGSEPIKEKMKNEMTMVVQNPETQELDQLWEIVTNNDGTIKIISILNNMTLFVKPSKFPPTFARKRDVVSLSKNPSGCSSWLLEKIKDK